MLDWCDVFSDCCLCAFVLRQHINELCDESPPSMKFFRGAPTGCNVWKAYCGYCDVG